MANSDYSRTGDEFTTFLAELPVLSKLSLCTFPITVDGASITKKGLVAIARTNLTELQIGKIYRYPGRTNCGDEEAQLVSRHHLHLRILWLAANEVGWEGVSAVSSGLTNLELVNIDGNR